MPICGNDKCEVEHDGTFGSGKYCSRACANARPWLEEKKKRVSESVKKTICESETEIRVCHCGKTFQTRVGSNRKFCVAGCAGKNQHSGRWSSHVDSILDASSRTVSKILKRIGKGCCRCGWNEATCDIHHILGRKIPNPDSHSNLTLLCPNCHRLFHTGKIGEADVISLEKYIGSDWKQFYYG